MKARKTVFKVLSAGMILGFSLVLGACNSVVEPESTSEVPITSMPQSVAMESASVASEAPLNTSSMPLPDSSIEADIVRDHAEFVAGPNGTEPVELRVGDSFLGLSVKAVEAYDAGGYYSWVRATFEGEITLKGQLLLFEEADMAPHVVGRVFFVPDEKSSDLLPYYYPDAKVFPIENKKSTARWIRMENEDAVRQMVGKDTGQFNDCEFLIQEYTHYYNHIEAYDFATLEAANSLGDYSEIIQY